MIELDFVRIFLSLTLSHPKYDNNIHRVNGTIILFICLFQFSKTVQTKNVKLREKIIRNRYVSIKTYFHLQKNIFVYIPAHLL